MCEHKFHPSCLVSAERVAGWGGEDKKEERENEGEDVEWCGRAFAHGFLIDMAPASRAYSQTSKLARRPRLGPLTPLAYLAKRSLAEWRGAITDRIERISGRR